MSLIHDALKRAERERGQPPGVFVPHDLPGEQGRDRGPVWPWVVAVTVIPLAALGGWATWNGYVFQSVPLVESMQAKGTTTEPPGGGDDQAGQTVATQDGAREAVAEAQRLASARSRSADDRVSDDPVTPAHDESTQDSTPGAGEAAPETEVERPVSQTDREPSGAESKASADDDARGDGVERTAQDQQSNAEQDREASEPTVESSSSTTGDEDGDSPRALSAVDEVKDDRSDADVERDETKDDQKAADPDRGEATADRKDPSEGEAEDANVQTADSSRAKDGEGIASRQGNRADDTATATSETAAVDLRARHEAWRSALSRGDMAAAEAELAEVQSALPPDHLMRLRMEGWTAYRRGELDRAVDRYRRINERRPGDADSALNLASIYLSLGKPSRALAVIAEARQHSPESAALKQAQQRIGS